MRSKQGMALMKQGAQRRRHRQGPGTFAEGKQQKVPAELHAQRARELPREPQRICRRQTVGKLG
ncbi:hypothetical protein ACFSVM_00100 [Paenibacillus shunpengii]|uniref:Uncharacterized protein n=1 Tax=Paenibacillus shunpengii TaxID=2054424 RepID=A0ABW5SGM5_9BACL